MFLISRLVVASCALGACDMVTEYILACSRLFVDESGFQREPDHPVYIYTRVCSRIYSLLPGVVSRLWRGTPVL